MQFVNVTQPYGTATNAAQNDTISEFVVTGNRTVPIERILTYMQTRKGCDFNKSHIYSDVTRLLDSHYIQNVQPEITKTDAGVKVTFVITEFPSTVEEVIYNNANRLSQQDLDAFVPFVRPGAPLNPAANMKKCREIQDYLKSLGHYWSNVTLEEGGRVDDKRVVLNITEGPVLRVRSISFLGNSEAFAAARLRGVIHTDLAFFGSAGLFHEGRIDNDVKRLEDFYQAQGHRRVKVAHELIIDESLRLADVVFHIHEGVKHKVAGCTIVGDENFADAETQCLLTTTPGADYSEAAIKAHVRNLTKQARRLGMNVDVATDVFDDERGFVQVRFTIKPRSTPVAEQDDAPTTSDAGWSWRMVLDKLDQLRERVETCCCIIRESFEEASDQDYPRRTLFESTNGVRRGRAYGRMNEPQFIDYLADLANTNPDKDNDVHHYRDSDPLGAPGSHSGPGRLQGSTGRDDLEGRVRQ